MSFLVADIGANDECVLFHGSDPDDRVEHGVRTGMREDRSTCPFSLLDDPAEGVLAPFWWRVDSRSVFVQFGNLPVEEIEMKRGVARDVEERHMDQARGSDRYRIIGGRDRHDFICLPLMSPRVIDLGFMGGRPKTGAVQLERTKNSLAH